MRLSMTGARDGAVASLKIKHINLFDGLVFQDGRDVNTKNGKTISTWFFPTGTEYRECFEAWVPAGFHAKTGGIEKSMKPVCAGRGH